MLVCRKLYHHAIARITVKRTRYITDVDELLLDVLKYMLDVNPQS